MSDSDSESRDGSGSDGDGGKAPSARLPASADSPFARAMFPDLSFSDGEGEFGSDDDEDRYRGASDRDDGSDTSDPEPEATPHRGGPRLLPEALRAYFGEIAIAHDVVVDDLNKFANTREGGSHAMYLRQGQEGLTKAGKRLLTEHPSVVLVSAGYLADLEELPEAERGPALLSTVRHELRHAGNVDDGLVAVNPEEIELALDEAIAHSENILNRQMDGAAPAAPLWDQLEHLNQAEDYLRKARASEDAETEYEDLLDRAERDVAAARKRVEAQLRELGLEPDEFETAWLNAVDLELDAFSPLLGDGPRGRPGKLSKLFAEKLHEAQEAGGNGEEDWDRDDDGDQDEIGSENGSVEDDGGKGTATGENPGSK